MPFVDDELDQEEFRERRPGFLTTLILILLIISLLGTLLWPLLRVRSFRPATPTATPVWQEARKFARVCRQLLAE